MRAVLLLPLPLLLLVPLAPAAAAEPVPVEVGILLINFGNYDVAKGTYVMDIYLWFRWDPAAAPEGFSPERFEFMNGRATSQVRLSDEVDAATGMRETFYRVQASLYSSPEFRNYPYDKQRLVMLLEDSVFTNEDLLYVPLLSESGLDEDVRVAGWRVKDVSLSSTQKTYRFDETYSRLEMEVIVLREPVSTSLKLLLPPVAFMLVSGLSFFFHPSKAGNRIALGTGMLISSVMFHVSQTVSLPPMGSLILFDKIMLAVYAFLAGSLIVTTLIVIDQDYWTEVDHARAINRWGAIVTLALPVVTFLVLLAF